MINDKPIWEISKKIISQIAIHTENCLKEAWETGIVDSYTTIEGANFEALTDRALRIIKENPGMEAVGKILKLSTDYGYTVVTNYYVVLVKYDDIRIDLVARSA